MESSLVICESGYRSLADLFIVLMCNSNLNVQLLHKDDEVSKPIKSQNLERLLVKSAGIVIVISTIDGFLQGLYIVQKF